MQLTDMDSAFILGKGGKTKQKIARVSGASLELHEHNCGRVKESFQVASMG